MPLAADEALEYVADFLQLAHRADQPYTVRDGINVARYALKLLGDGGRRPLEALAASVEQTLGEEATRHLPTDDA